ncbi:MAG: maleylpyruvate isomerase family mycothiol-dependent enzyme [Acidimicrobiia bacterium]
MEVLAALASQQDELSGLLAGRDEVEWQRPSPCESWTVADVVLHLAQTNELSIASAQGRLPEVAKGMGGPERSNTVDDSAALMVAAERGAPVQALHDRWLEGVETLRSVLAAADPHQRVMWVAGELSIRTLATTRLAETWIHTGDVATAFGVESVPTHRLQHVARLAWRTLPYAFERAGRQLHGPVAFKLRSPTGAAWEFVPDEAPLTVVEGDAVELCLVAARRIDPTDTGLTATGPDADAVLDLVRTYA